MLPLSLLLRVPSAHTERSLIRSSGRWGNITPCDAHVYVRVGITPADYVEWLTFEILFHSRGPVVAWSAVSYPCGLVALKTRSSLVQNARHGASAESVVERWCNASSKPRECNRGSPFSSNVCFFRDESCRHESRGSMMPACRVPDLVFDHAHGLALVLLDDTMPI